MTDEAYISAVFASFYAGAREFIDADRQEAGDPPLEDHDEVETIIAGTLAYLSSRATRLGKSAEMANLLLDMHKEQDR